MSTSTKTTFYQFVGIATEGATKDGYLTKRMVKQPEGYFPSKAEAKAAARSDEEQAYFNKASAKEIIANNRAEKFKGLNHPIQATVSESALPKMIAEAIATHGNDAVTVIDDSVLVDESKSTFIDRQVAKLPEAKQQGVKDQAQQIVEAPKGYKIEAEANGTKAFTGRGWRVGEFQKYGQMTRCAVQKTTGAGIKGFVSITPRGHLYPSFISGEDKNDVNWLVRAVIAGEGAL